MFRRDLDLVKIIGEGDSAGLAPPAGMDLRLDDPSLAAKEAGRGFGFGRAEGDSPARHGDAVGFEETLRLIFMDPHGILPSVPDHPAAARLLQNRYPGGSFILE